MLISSDVLDNLNTLHHCFEEVSKKEAEIQRLACETS